MNFYRIGEKVINDNKIHRKVRNILQLREKGYSQAKVAEELDVKRTLISRLENIGEIRKGSKIALVGFPVANKQEILKMGKKYGLEFMLLLTEQERWSFIEDKTGLELFNALMEIMARLKEFDLVIFLGSDMRLDLIDKLMDGKIIGLKLGKSPITEDKHVEVNKIEKIINEFL